MKVYISRATRWLALLTLVSAAILASGIVSVVADSPNVVLQLIPTFLGGFLTILFLSCFFAEKSRTLVIDAEWIIFPRGADRNGKTVLQKTIVRLDDIRSVESKFHKGDRIIAEDCFFHTLKLKDGTHVTVTLYAYGTEAEKEILEAIQKNIA